jgi:putative N6-adenine-specific DNA methylase
MYPTGKENNDPMKSRILITCSKGITPFLSTEVLQSAFPVLSETIAGITTEGTLTDTYRLNLLLRTAHRILYLLKEFPAHDADDLYREVHQIPWEMLIPADEYICVTSSVDNPSIRDSRFANVKCKDAIVDRIREKTGRRPDSGPDRNGVVTNLYWKGNDCSLYLDTTGEPLSRRGYRKIPMTAPMQETLAAAVIMASGWDGRGHFINPMCGSGTLAIEAALLGVNRAPGILRDNFGFMHIRGFDRQLWDDLRSEAKRAAKKAVPCRIIATDIKREAIEAAKKNAATAGVEQLIEFGVCDYADTAVPDGEGVVILNPEYGARMGRIRELESVYSGIGDFFKQKCRGFAGYIFTGNLELAKKVGLRSKRRIPFFNSGIECRLLEYELYEGSRKQKNAGSENSV